MSFLPDTNLWISLLKNPGGRLEHQIRLQPIADIYLCSIVKAELWHGAEKYSNREQRMRALEKLFFPFVSLPFDDLAAEKYGVIRHQLEQKGQTIGPNDLKIASIALVHDMTLVSGNNEFKRVSGLKVEDWTKF